MMSTRVWYKKPGDTTPTLFSDDTIDRPDESFFDSDVPVDGFVQFYTIQWPDNVPSLIRNADADDLLLQLELEASKNAKEEELDQAFAQAEGEPVLTDHGTFYGGKESARDLFFERELAKELGLSTVDFIDTNHLTHTLDIAQATEVIHTVSLNFRTKLFKKHNKKKAAIKAKTKNDVDFVTWESTE